MSELSDWFNTRELEHLRETAELVNAQSPAEKVSAAESADRAKSWAQPSVTTVEELDALPGWSVVMEDRPPYFVAQKWGDEWRTTASQIHTSKEMSGLVLTVLFRADRIEAGE